MFDRAAKSTLKAAILLCASRSTPEDAVIELVDVLQAIRFAQGWLPHSVDVIENVGKPAAEHTLERALGLIMKGKDTRSEFMRSMHLTKRDTDWILDTLEERGLIRRQRMWKTERLFPTHVPKGRT
jgi:hypothetical protein